MTAVYDEDVGMWRIDDTENPEDALAAQAESHLIEERAASVALAVADEVNALAYQLNDFSPWVQQGEDVLGEILRYQIFGRFRRCHTTPDLEAAPWGVLLDTSLPLGVDWHPREHIRLRGVCMALRGKRSTAEHFSEILQHLGVSVRMGSPEALAKLTFRIFNEMSFVHRVQGVAARGFGLRADDPAAAELCCVAGSYALNRFLLLGDRTTTDPSTRSKRNATAGLAQPADPGGAAPGVSWTPGDIDVFLGCRGTPNSRLSVQAFNKVVEHGLWAAQGLWSGAKLPSNHWGAWMPSDLHARMPKTWPVDANVKYTSEYNGLGELPTDIHAAMTTPGVTYPRELVLQYLHGDEETADLQATIRGLEPTLGIRRPFRVERVAEIRPFKSNFDNLLRGASCSYGSLWPMPMKINVIQISNPRGKPLAPSEVVSAFDLVPAMMSMQVDRGLVPHFTASEEARLCAITRELRLSKYAFGPSRDGHMLQLEEAILKQLGRISKYKKYGFTLRPQPEP